MRTAATIVAAILLLVLESVAVAVLDVETWVPHMGVGLVIYLALERELGEGGASTLVVAWVADLLGGAPPGVIGLTLTALYFLVRISSARLSYRRWFVRGALAMGAALVHQVLVLGVLAVVGHRASLLSTFALAAAPSALSAPVGLALSWVALARLDALFSRRTRPLLGE